jgi:hypothetical protein
MSDIVKCECGETVRFSIREGNNPGCKEREDIHCPNCNALLHSGVYNDAFVSIDVISQSTPPNKNVLLK